MGQPDTCAVTPRQPMTRAQKNGAKLFAALVGGPGPAALANEKRAADEQAAAASTNADS